MGINLPTFRPGREGLTVDEVAQQLRVNRERVYALIRDGLLGDAWKAPSPKNPRSRCWFVSPEALQALKERGELQPKEDEPSGPVFIRLPDEGMPHDPDERRAIIRRLRAEAYAAQEA